jgi:hypothetical protein
MMNNGTVGGTKMTMIHIDPAMRGETYVDLVEADGVPRRIMSMSHKINHAQQIALIATLIAQYDKPLVVTVDPIGIGASYLEGLRKAIRQVRIEPKTRSGKRE